MTNYEWNGESKGFGIRYFCIREVDYNGDSAYSDAVVVDVPVVKSQYLSGFDLLGRSVQSGDYRYIVKPNR